MKRKASESQQAWPAPASPSPQSSCSPSSHTDSVSPSIQPDIFPPEDGSLCGQLLPPQLPSFKGQMSTLTPGLARRSLSRVLHAPPDQARLHAPDAPDTASMSLLPIIINSSVLSLRECRVSGLREVHQAEDAGCPACPGSTRQALAPWFSQYPRRGRVSLSPHPREEGAPSLPPLSSLPTTRRGPPSSHPGPALLRHQVLDLGLCPGSEARLLTPRHRAWGSPPRAFKISGKTLVTSSISVFQEK